MRRLKSTTLLLLSLVTHSYAMEQDQETLDHDNTFASFLASNSLTLIEERLKTLQNNPNGSTPLGTPYAAFISSQKALTLMYAYGLDHDTLEKAVTRYLKNENLVQEDHTAAWLLACNDPFAKLLDVEKRKKLKDRFVKSYHNNKNPAYTYNKNPKRDYNKKLKSAYNKDLASVYQDAIIYLEWLEIKDSQKS